MAAVPILAWVVLTAAFGVATVTHGWAQNSETRPQFEVASIKRSAPGATGSRCCVSPGGRLNVKNNRISNLIGFAWTMKYYQLAGGPDWLESDHFDIEAKAEGNPGPNEMKRMIQTLLEDRFQLKVHVETRQMPVFDLTLAKGGPKIQRFQDGDCVPFDPAHPAAQPAAGEKRRDFCGFNILAQGRWNASGITMQQVASALADITSRPVLDKTGLTGLFNIHMDYVEDGLAADTAGPSIFTAVQEELGLKLNASKGPAEVLVIDHVERPSEN